MAYLLILLEAAESVIEGVHEVQSVVGQIPIVFSDAV